jgi:hypothetical protein
MVRPFAGSVAVAVVACIAWGSAQQKAPVDDAALRSVEGRNQDWLSYGRDYYEQRFSPLDQINDKNVGQLGLAWQFETATNRGLEATPLVVDGVMYATGSWSVTYAIDARSGKQLWKYDPGSASQVRQHRLLRRRQSRRRVLQGARLRRRARRPARGDRCGERQGGVADDDGRSEAAVYHHGRAENREGQDHHRQRRRRVRRARIRVRVRRETGQARVALLHRAGRSVEAAGEQGARARAADLEGQATGGSTAAAAPCGIRSSTIPS